jgi:hypothetical protein
MKSIKFDYWWKIHEWYKVLFQIQFCLKTQIHHVFY